MVWQGDFYATQIFSNNITALSAALSAASVEKDQRQQEYTNTQIASVSAASVEKDQRIQDQLDEFSVNRIQENDSGVVVNDIGLGTITISADGVKVAEFSNDSVIVNGTLTVSGAAKILSFQGTPGGADEGVQYLDLGGLPRYGLIFPGGDMVALGNRAENGIVQIRANTSVAGAGGEKISAEFHDNKIRLLPNTDPLVPSGTVATLHPTGGKWEKQQYFIDTDLSANGTSAVNWDLQNKQMAFLSMTNSFSIRASGGPHGIGSYTLLVKQTSGSGILTFEGGPDPTHHDFLWAGGTPPTLSTGANDEDVISFLYRNGNLDGVANNDFS